MAINVQLTRQSRIIASDLSNINANLTRQSRLTIVTNNVNTFLTRQSRIVVVTTADQIVSHWSPKRPKIGI